MQKSQIGKILAVGIICLFIGVGIHPAFPVEVKSSTSENKDNLMDPLTYEIAIDYNPPKIYCRIYTYNGGLAVDVEFAGFSCGLKIYIGDTLDKEYSAPPYDTFTWSSPWELLPPLSCLHSEIKIGVEDNAGNYIECYPFPKPENIFIVGFIRNHCLSKRYLGFFAKYIYTSNSGVVEFKDLEFVMDRYFGLIGRNIILAKIWGWQVPIYD